MRLTKTERLAKYLNECGRCWGPYPPCNRRNGKPADGWGIVGNAMITRAIRSAGLPTENYWSGSNPTPSTQAPKNIIDEAYRILDTI